MSETERQTGWECSPVGLGSDLATTQHRFSALAVVRLLLAVVATGAIALHPLEFLIAAVAWVAFFHAVGWNSTSVFTATLAMLFGAAIVNHFPTLSDALAIGAVVGAGVGCLVWTLESRRGRAATE